jgi:hypothetical protein
MNLVGLSEAVLKIGFKGFTVAWFIRHAVWLYYRFTLSYRDVEEFTKASVAGRSNSAP